VFFRRDGTAVDVLCSNTPILVDGSVGGAVLVVHDITDRKQAEEALRRSEDRFAAIFRQVIVGISQVDLTGRFITVNDRFCDIAGRPMEEVLRLRTQDITHEEDVPANLELMERARRYGEDFQLEKRYIRPDGSAVWVSNSVSVMRDADGHPQYLVAVVQDITERKAIEAGMLRANQELVAALAEREVLIKEVHHRVKNNLQVVVSLLRLQASRLRDRAAAEALRESLNRVAAMSTIHELLYRSATLVDIDFAEVLGTLAENLRDAYGVPEARIRVNVALRPVPVSMDLAVPLALIATELISNVFKHAFRDGAAGEVWITLAQTDGNVELGVADNGVGFTPPERTTSLGLMLVERLVRQVAGRMELGPPPGTRYRLTVRLE